VIAARFRARLPEDAWVSAVSRSFPDARFRLLAGIQRGDTAIELGESFADDPGAIVAAAEAHSGIVSIERLEVADRRAFTKHETTDTGLYALFRHASMPPEFPVTVRDGWFEFDFTGTRDGFERVRTVLEGVGRSYDLVSIVESPDDEDPLTDRQREVLAAALREGYLSVPRECTLADLAETLDVDGSTASGIVRRAQARLAKRHLIASGDGAGRR